MINFLLQEYLTAWKELSHMNAKGKGIDFQYAGNWCFSCLGLRKESIKCEISGGWKRSQKFCQKI